MDQPYWGKKKDNVTLFNYGYVIGICSRESGGPKYRIDWDPEKKLHVNFDPGNDKEKWELLVTPDSDDAENPTKSERKKCDEWIRLSREYCKLLPKEVKDQLLKWANSNKPSDLREYARNRICSDFPQLPRDWEKNTIAGPNPTAGLHDKKWQWCMCMRKNPVSGL
jgi:hypothetical protein